MNKIRTVTRARGVTIIYLVFFLVVLLGFASLIIDWARVQSAKAEIKDATNAAVRAALSGLQKGESVVISRGIEYGGMNTVNGQQVTVTASNIKLGRWNSTTRTFTQRGSEPYYLLDAVQIEAKMEVPLIFSRVLPRVTVSAVSVAALTDKPTVIPGTCNPWLSGMPPGTPGNTEDVAGDENQSPIQVMGVSLVAGSSLTFGPVTGSVLNYPDMNALNDWTPDGGDIYDHVGEAEHGMADLKAPINSLIGVFLTDEQPDKVRGTMPEALDYTTSKSRNKTSYSPKLRQPFFIGDGKTNNGVLQSFVVPNGATRLYLGTMDGYEWNNNVGSLTLGQNIGKGGITLVK